MTTSIKNTLRPATPYSWDVINEGGAIVGFIDTHHDSYEVNVYAASANAAEVRMFDVKDFESASSALAAAKRFACQSV